MWCDAHENSTACWWLKCLNTMTSTECLTCMFLFLKTWYSVWTYAIDLEWWTAAHIFIVYLHASIGKNTKPHCIWDQQIWHIWGLFLYLWDVWHLAYWYFVLECCSKYKKIYIKHPNLYSEPIMPCVSTSTSFVTMEFKLIFEADCM